MCKERLIRLILKLFFAQKYGFPLAHQHTREKSKIARVRWKFPPSPILLPPQTHTFHVQGNTGGAEWTKITTSTGIFYFQEKSVLRWEV